MSVVSDSRGMIYVLDLFYQHIQVFHPTGAFSHTIGGEGVGPGEFSAARAISIGPGDTLRVVDDGAVRYSSFAPDGTFRESHPRRIVGFYSSATPTFLSDGRYVDWGIFFPDGRSGPRTVIWPIQFGPGFAGPDSLRPLQHTSKMLPSGRRPEYYFSGALSIAIDRRGNIWFAHTQEYRIYRRSLEGDTTLVFSLPADPPPLGDAEREYVRTSFARSPDLLSEYLRALPRAKPIVHRIVPDNAGHIFVFVDVAGVPAGTAVDVFRENGHYMGRMTLPTAVPLFPTSRDSPVVHATPEHLFVVVEDDLDVPYVSRLKIVKGP